MCGVLVTHTLLLFGHTTVNWPQIIKPKVTESHSNLSFSTINFLPFVKENFQPEEAP